MARLSGRNPSRKVSINGVERLASEIDASAIFKLKEEGRLDEYQDALTAFIQQTDILSEKQAALEEAEMMQAAVGAPVLDHPDANFRKKDIVHIARSKSGRNIEITDDGVVIDHGYKNAIKPPKSNPDKFIYEIGEETQPKSTLAVNPRVKDVMLWANDPVAAAYVDPVNVDVATASPVMMRARNMGLAASQGDRAGVVNANKRYPILPGEARRFMDATRIKGKGTAAATRTSGLQGRLHQVIDPETGQLVMGSGNEDQFFDTRNEDLWERHLETGMTGFLNPRNNIVVPGNDYQMEHDQNFGKHNALGGLAETKANRVGFYERHLNSEKAEQDATAYYQMQRLAYLANKRGIDITGIIKGDYAPAQLGAMLEKANPTTTFSNERLVKDRTATYHQDRADVNTELLNAAMERLSEL